MDYYEILEVSPKASPEVLRAAYKSLMQRHHPDKLSANSNSASASHAALIVQAYEVLSNAERRAAYDAQLPQRLQAQPAAPASQPAPRPAGAYSRRPAAPAPASNWYLWLLAIVILGASALMLAFSAKKPALPAEPGLRIAPDNRLAPAETPAAVVTETTKEAEPPAPASRSIALLSADLHVVLVNPDNLADDPEASRHLLTIPAISVEIGPIEAEKFAKSFERKKEAVLQKLAERLTRARYAELRIEGDRYLGKFILDTLRDITGTKGLDDSTTASGTETSRYGVVAVSLPASFALR